MRGLEAWTSLPPSESYLQGDFKNISLMLQDKSLITGNYGPPIPILLQLQPPPLLFFSLQKTLRLTLATFILSFNRRSSPGERPGAREGVGDEAITWEQTVIMVTDALLHFHSCGVAHLWAAITQQMIQTEPCDEVVGLSEYSCTVLLCLCAKHCPIWCKTVELLSVLAMCWSFAGTDPQLLHETALGVLDRGIMRNMMWLLLYTCGSS